MMRTIITLALFVATLASAKGFEAQNGYVSPSKTVWQDFMLSLPQATSAACP